MLYFAFLFALLCDENSGLQWFRKYAPDIARDMVFFIYEPFGNLIAPCEQRTLPHEKAPQRF